MLEKVRRRIDRTRHQMRTRMRLLDSREVTTERFWKSQLHPKPKVIYTVFH